MVPLKMMPIPFAASFEMFQRTFENILSGDCEIMAKATFLKSTTDNEKGGT